ncbi:MAG: efflux RND transporter permease subunit, partial [Parvularculaceae bacterium]|nr:efflux RND transporter permease subunit [Parvularculaceae bacterium]
TKLCLKNPAAVGVVLALIALLGVVSITKLPIQLLPNIERPELGIWTGWRSASPREVESEIIEPIERELRGLPGLKSMQSWSNAGGGFVRLEFSLATDMDKALTEVTSRLQRVRGLPAEADRPAIGDFGGGSAGDTLIFLFLQRLPGNNNESMKMREFAESRIAPELEAIEGVAGVDVNADDGEEIIRVSFDPFRLAQLGVTIDEVARTVNRSTDVTGGSIKAGRRNYTMRFEGRYAAEQLGETILAWRNGAPIRLSDVADVSVANDRRGGVVYQNGNPAIGMRVMREPGSNTLAAIDAITAKLKELNDGELRTLGYTIQKSFDPSLFIKNALSLLAGNLFLGMMLTVAIIWVFLRRNMATLLIALTIPICLGATMVVLNLLGRSINVISLAGLAFATGMALDAAIVVVEDYIRIRRQGATPPDAAAKTIAQVMGALFASTVTTIAVFIPIIFFDDVEGQLFTDLALTISVAVALSMIVAVTVLPTGMAMLMKKQEAPEAIGKRTLFDRAADGVMKITSTPGRRAAWIAGLTILPIAIGWAIFPALNYLPRVKRAAIDGFIGFPSGASADMIRAEFADVVVKRLDPYMKGEKEPALLNYYLYSGDWGGNIGVRPKVQSRMDELEKIVNEEILSGFPDTRVFAQQGDLFGDFGGGGQVRVELQAADYDALSDAIPAATDIITAAIAGTSVWPNPDPQIVTPELRLMPNDRRIAEVGMTRESVASAVRALGDGLWLGEFFNEDSRVDIILEATEGASPEDLALSPIATPTGSIVPLGDLASFEQGVGPQQIYRLDGRRTISLGVNAPKEMPLGDIVRQLEEKAESEIYSILPEGASMKFAGEADSLKRAIVNLGGNFLLAVAILFLIMAALFKSLKDSFFVVISLPMAAVGGIAAMRILNLVNPTPLDLLGMMGFILMLGIVVNNAVLLVAQTRQSEAEGMSCRDAVREALRHRTRPIFLTMAVTLAGTVPMVVAPGEGAQIYRGLAAVSVGGAVVSAFFTLILLPALLQLGPLKLGVRSERPALQPAA